MHQTQEERSVVAPPCPNPEPPPVGTRVRLASRVDPWPAWWEGMTGAVESWAESPLEWDAKRTARPWGWSCWVRLDGHADGRRVFVWSSNVDIE